MVIEDQDIIKSIKSGKDQKVLNNLYTDMYPGVRNYVCANSGNEDEAFDIFQEAVIILFKQVRLDRFDPQYKIKSFLFTVAKNLWINRVKRMNRTVNLKEDYDFIETNKSVLHNLIDEERNNLIHYLLDQIGENCKQLLTLSVFESLSMKEICKKMGYSSENAAKTRNYKCKQKLIDLIKNNELIAKELMK